MQTRSGKTYTTNSSSSSKKKNNIRLNMKVDNVDNRITLTMQTRSGKTYNSGNTYTATNSSNKKNNIKLEIKVENVFKPNSFTKSTPISTDRRPSGFIQSTTNSTDRRPSRFIVPTKISDELANFLGKPVGTEMSRINVSSIINAYIRVNKLQDPKNGRIINPDEKLRNLLKIGENDELTYFNIQKYMKHHFIQDANVVNRNSFTKSTPISIDRRPSGFVRPSKISDELANFLGKPLGTEMLRTEVSRIINSYISVNNLQDPKNGRIINPDEKLRNLLKLGENDELTYFNMQKYMKVHFNRE
jgi:chromatin remodeling complex protein RSC6